MAPETGASGVAIPGDGRSLEIRRMRCKIFLAPAGDIHHQRGGQGPMPVLIALALRAAPPAPASPVPG